MFSHRLEAIRPDLHKGWVLVATVGHLSLLVFPQYGDVDIFQLPIAA